MASELPLSYNTALKLSLPFFCSTSGINTGISYCFIIDNFYGSYTKFSISSIKRSGYYHCSSGAAEFLPLNLSCAVGVQNVSTSLNERRINLFCGADFRLLGCTLFWHWLRAKAQPRMMLKLKPESITE